METATRTKMARAHFPTAAQAAIAVRKLETSEDEGLQQTLARLAHLDTLAREYVIVGLPESDSAEDWARVFEDVSRLVAADGCPLPENLDDDSPVQFTHFSAVMEWSYLLGLAVGLRLAGIR